MTATSMGTGSGPRPTPMRTTGALLLAAAKKLDPRSQVRNPILFVIWVGAALTTVIAVAEPLLGGTAPSGGTAMPGAFTWALAIWLWLTLLVANLAEALAEGRGRKQASSLRLVRESTTAHLLVDYDAARDAGGRATVTRDTPSTSLRPGDVVALEAGDVVPADGEIVWGVASVDESPITGESAPVIRESGGDRTAVTGGSRVLSDRLIVRIVRASGDSAVDRMIELAEGARRKRAPNELALGVLLASFSIAFVVMALTINAIASPVSAPVSVPVLVAVVACLLPTEIAALLSVTGIAGMATLLRHNVLVDSSRALENAGDITTVLLDKTGTVTEGDRSAHTFAPLRGVTMLELATAAALASLDDPTPEGTSTLALARSHGVSDEQLAEAGGRSVTFSAQTRMSGRDLPGGRSVRKGAERAVLAWLKHVGVQQPREVVAELRAATAAIARAGGTPLVVAEHAPRGAGRVLGTVDLSDTVKPTVAARIGRLRELGVRSVMLTGDNALTAAAIATEAGIDAHVGDTTPEEKLAYIKRVQSEGHVVAMSGDGTNDAPALAQADVGVAMNGATASAKDAANMIVLDDDPTKLVEIIETGSRVMATRGALTTFNIANDLVRYVALFPALFVGAFPQLEALDLLQLHSPASAVLSTVIFSVVVIGILIPLAILGVPYRTTHLGRSLTRNLLVYGIGGIVVAAVAIKLIDLIVGAIPGF